jgi:hypothetical protein
MHAGQQHGGGCRCGQVRFSAAAAPIWTAFCHCGDCRKATGAPVSAFVGFESAAFACTGVMTHYANGSVSRGFCPQCGSPITYRDERLVGEIYVMAGVMDEPALYAPKVHGFTQEMLPWLKLDDGLPHDSGFTRQRPGKG